MGDNSKYEAALIDALTEALDSGDHVVIVGGGLGVTAVHAARAGATVTTYEAGDTRATLAEKTVERAGHVVEIDIHHAIVGDAVAVDGETTAPVVSPVNLPTADVLELDCEGAELKLLEGSNNAPVRLSGKRMGT